MDKYQTGRCHCFFLHYEALVGPLLPPSWGSFHLTRAIAFGNSAFLSKSRAVFLFKPNQKQGFSPQSFQLMTVPLVCLRSSGDFSMFPRAAFFPSSCANFFGNLAKVNSKPDPFNSDWAHDSFGKTSEVSVYQYVQKQACSCVCCLPYTNVY